jgi:hypothetical protein
LQSRVTAALNSSEQRKTPENKVIPVGARTRRFRAAADQKNAAKQSRVA